MTTSQQDIKAPEQDDMRQITVRVPADLHRRIRVAVARNGNSVSPMIAGWLERWVEHQESQNG